MRLDYHMHTAFSDGKSEMVRYIDEAAKKGIGEIGFSDHFHLHKETCSMDPKQLNNYVDTISGFKQTSRIPVKAGLEVEFVPSSVETLMQAIRRFDFDYLMGSVHYIGDWLIDSKSSMKEWARRDPDEVYEQYFYLVQTMARMELFDIVGHLDLVKIFNIRPKNNLDDLLLETVQTIRKSGMCIEVNTGGLRKPCREIYPSERLLKMCFDQGLPIAFGSDAHSPNDVGADFDKAVDLVTRVGYDEIVRFTQRRREFVQL